MSTLLEQAIVDAKALRETAMKNAEAVVIEKYSEEVKSAVNTILEQVADPFAEVAAMPPEPPQQEEETEADDKLNPISEQIPDAFLGENESPVVINLDELESHLNSALADEGIDPFENVGEDLTLQDIYDEDDMDGFPWGETQSATPPSAIQRFEDDLLRGDTDNPGKRDPFEGAGYVEEDYLDEDYLDEEYLDEDYLEEHEDPRAHSHITGLAEEVRFHGFDGPEASGYHHLPEEILKELEELRAIAKEHEEEDDKKEEIQKENRILKTAGQRVLQENQKLRHAVDKLGKVVESTNVSNAKLLYINQTLGNASLNERQKSKIVENISRADSVQEAKVIYDTLQGAVGTMAREPLPQSLSEAVNRRSSLLVAASKRDTKTSEHSPFFERMQTLAGIKKIT